MADTSSSAAAAKKTPSDFLKSVLGRPVDVKLNNGVEYRGVLACLDGFMNIAMEQTQEYVNGQLKAQYGDCFIRGNNGTCTPGVFAHREEASVLTLSVSVLLPHSALHLGVQVMTQPAHRPPIHISSGVYALR